MLEHHVLSKINTAHTSGSDVPEQFVLAEEEPFVLALEYLLGLPAGQESSVFKGLTNRDRILQQSRI